MAKSNSALLRDEYGDWQTNYPLALSVCQMLKNKGINPQVIIEPTCGKGNFILAALETFNTLEHVIGIEINAEYLTLSLLPRNQPPPCQKIKILVLEVVLLG